MTREERAVRAWSRVARSRTEETRPTAAKHLNYRYKRLTALGTQKEPLDGRARSRRERGSRARSSRARSSRARSRSAQTSISPEKHLHNRYQRLTALGSKQETLNSRARSSRARSSRARSSRARSSRARSRSAQTSISPEKHLHNRYQRLTALGSKQETLNSRCPLYTSPSPRD